MGTLTAAVVGAAAMAPPDLANFVEKVGLPGVVAYMVIRLASVVVNQHGQTLNSMLEEFRSLREEMGKIGGELHRIAENHEARIAALETRTPQDEAEGSAPNGVGRCCR